MHEFPAYSETVTHCSNIVWIKKKQRNKNKIEGEIPNVKICDLERHVLNLCTSGCPSLYKCITGWIVNNIGQQLIYQKSCHYYVRTVKIRQKIYKTKIIN